MIFLKLDYIKQHSRIDYDCEDAVLEVYANSAEEALAMLLNRGDTVEEMVQSLQEQYGKVPANIYHAALMLVDTSYTQRSPISTQNISVVPYSIDLMVKPYMRLT